MVHVGVGLNQEGIGVKHPIGSKAFAYNRSSASNTADEDWDNWVPSKGEVDDAVEMSAGDDTDDVTPTTSTSMFGTSSKPKRKSVFARSLERHKPVFNPGWL